MPAVVTVDVAAHVLAQLEAIGTSLGAVVEATSAGAALLRLESGGSDVLAVVVGDGADPVRTAQRSRVAAPGVPVMLVVSRERCATLDERLRLDPFVAGLVPCFADAPVDALELHVRGVIDQSRRRRGLQQTLSALNRRLGDTAAASPPVAALVLDRLLEVAPIGVVLCREDLTIRAVNPCAEELLGIGAADAIGSNLADAFPAAERPRLRATVAQRAHADGPFVVGTTRRRQLEVSKARLASAGEGSLLVLLHDVTERAELVAELRAANARKDEFLAMLGHELRNPLAPIRTALDLMTMRGETAAARERDVIRRQVDHMVQLVDDLLDIARITGGRLEIDRRVISVADVVDDAVELASPLVEQKRHHLEVDVDASLRVDGARRRLAQVVTNLITNAAKYTAAGGRIAVRAARRGDDVEIAVVDSGRGIPPDILPHVFDAFVQAPQGLDRKSGGLGLGLAIVKSLVEAHGGTVTARSEVDVGSELVVRLRACATAADAVPAPSRAGATRPAAAVIRVLVVDDNRDAADLIADALASEDLVADVAYDGPAALARAAAAPPAVVLLDIGLPVMDGFEVARRLRATPALAAVRLIALTGYGTASDRERTAAAGFDAHLVKPIDLAELTATIHRVTAVEKTQ